MTGNAMTSIIVKTKFEGVHKYAQAPEPVKYLREAHRHLFGVEVQMEVFHDDRELEFILVKHAIDSYIQSNIDEDTKVWMMDTLSCEQVGKDLINFLVHTYGEREIAVAIMEDDENGAKVYYYPTDNE